MAENILDSMMSSYPYPGYNFCMFLDGLKIGFKTVSGLTLKKENYTPYHEGGDNFFVGIHRNSKSDANRLTLTKGLGFFNPSKLMSKVNVMLMVVFDNSGKPIHAYAFSPGYIESVTVSDFNAQESSVIIDTTVIMYDFAVEIDLTGRTTMAAYVAKTISDVTSASDREQRTSETVARIAKHNAEVLAAKKMKEREKTASNKPKLEY